MTHGPVLVAAAAFVDLLVHSTELALRDRLVLETGIAAAETDAGALWRRDHDGTWRPSVERGRRGGRFEALRATRRALESPVLASPPGLSIVRAEIAGRGVALVLAGAVGEETEDALEALLTCMSVVEHASGDAHARPAAPLPARPGELGRIEHDVRNALSSLMATQQILARYGADLAPEERRAFTEAIDRECERTGSILAHGLTGRADARGDVASAAEITGDVVALERAGLEAAGCTPRLTLAEATRSARLACGADAWSRIVRNLLANAREAAEARGQACTIAVGLECCGAGVRLAIEDAAGGLPATALASLFREGFTSGKAGGSGRGLGVVRALVVDAGGTILVERRPRGARFEVWMPCSPVQNRDAIEEARDR